MAYEQECQWKRSKLSGLSLGWRGLGWIPVWGWGGILAHLGHLAGRSQVGFKRGALRQLPGFRHAQIPNWQELVVAVGPERTQVRPEWTGHPQGTTLTSLRQGPRQVANGSDGGIRERHIRVHPGGREAR